MEKVEIKLKTLHARFQDNYDHSGKRFSLLKDQLLKIEQQIEVCRGAREDIMQAKHSELNDLQQKIALQIQEEMKVRDESELRLRK